MAINLEECGILREDILQGVVMQLCERFDSGDASFVNAEVHKHIGERSKKLVDDAIQAQVDEILKTPFQPINIWGDRQGEPTTVKDLVEKALSGYWTQKVDLHGKTSSQNSYSAHTATRAEFMTKKLVGEILDEKMRKDFDKIFKDMKAQLKDALGSEIKKAVERYMK